MSLIARLLQEPLLHFLVLGAFVFAVFAAVQEPDAVGPVEDEVVITDTQVQQTVSQFRDTWRRMPTREELDRLIEALVREEILVREAQALSMDKGDAIIRRRLAQKMSFLMESAAGAQETSETDLIAYFEANRSKYAGVPMLAFEQVYLGEAPKASEIEITRTALAEGIEPEGLGVSTLLPDQVDMLPPNAIDGRFGRGFFEALSQLPVGEWSAPIPSGFGLHLVRVTQISEGTVPDFDRIRDKVAADFRTVAAEELAEEIFAEVRSGYRVSLPSDAALDEVLQ